MEKGKIYFYTATIHAWKNVLLDDDRKDIIINSLVWLVNQKAVKVYAFVIMPNHIHLIWQPLENKKFKNLQLSFMRFTAQKILFHLQDSNSPFLAHLLIDKRDRKYQIWQRNPLAVELYSRKTIEQKLDYVHNNPVQGTWMLADSPQGYVYSSANYYENEDVTYSFLTHYMDDI